jgi:hypothetical protein
MLRRFQHDFYSRPFSHGLFSTTPPSPDTLICPFPEPHSVNTSPGRRDAAFIESLSQPITEHFLRLSELGIPKLMSLVAGYKARSTLPPIYTRETCEEFHHLLCHLLRCYEAALLTLADFNGLDLSNDPPQAFEIAIYGVATCGLTLHNLIYSSFLEEHLIRIHLPDPRSERRSDAGSVGVRNADSDENGDGKPDTELANVQPSTGAPGFRLSVTEAYIAWLQLQVVYFEAVDTLLGVAARFRGVPFSITVIAVVKPAKTIRSWQNIINDTIFPSNASEALKAISTIQSSLARDVKVTFFGTQHCEATLAGLINSGELPVSTIYNV